MNRFRSPGTCWCGNREANVFADRRAAGAASGRKPRRGRRGRDAVTHRDGRGWTDAETECSQEAPGGARFAGLINQGLTCYLNALLQCLFLTPEFRDRIQEKPWTSEPEQALGQIFRGLQRRCGPVPTSALTTCLGLHSSVQQDVAEVFLLLLQHLGRDELQEVFQSEVEKIIQCLVCGHEEHIPSGGRMLILPLASHTQLCGLEGAGQKPGKPANPSSGVSQVGPEFPLHHTFRSETPYLLLYRCQDTEDRQEPEAPGPDNGDMRTMTDVAVPKEKVPCPGVEGETLNTDSATVCWGGHSQSLSPLQDDKPICHRQSPAKKYRRDMEPGLGDRGRASEHVDEEGPKAPLPGEQGEARGLPCGPQCSPEEELPAMGMRSSVAEDQALSHPVQGPAQPGKTRQPAVLEEMQGSDTSEPGGQRGSRGLRSKDGGAEAAREGVRLLGDREAEVMATRERGVEVAKEGGQLLRDGGLEAVASREGGGEAVAAREGEVEAVAAREGGVEAVAAREGGAEAMATREGRGEAVAAREGGAEAMAAREGGVEAMATREGGAEAVATREGRGEAVATREGGVEAMATREGCPSEMEEGRCQASSVLLW
ncbi:uncharacterized protein LOC103876647 isoform X11 [Papio anubis]|uniref:uncharacterized protein LOC103876647 isoform X11 n=1 Tax=Papio anubis TaxID=9555 RepID=UPI0012ADED7D|nr:uncharacterized protein LOC103876647 isoform X11 [Papio anubis]